MGQILALLALLYIMILKKNIFYNKYYRNGKKMESARKSANKVLSARNEIYSLFVI